MANIEHDYSVHIQWTGNRGSGTSGYRNYDRAHEISAVGKPILHGSSDPAFQGDSSKYNPEDLLVASVSSCHMMWYLHLCADAKIIVQSYHDQAQGKMIQTAKGGGRFDEIVLRPQVTIDAGADPNQARELHKRAHECCFIANSLNCSVHCEPSISIEGAR